MNDLKPVSRRLSVSVSIEIDLALKKMISVRKALDGTDCWHLAHEVCEEIWRLQDGLSVVTDE